MSVARVCWVSSRAGRPGDWRRMPRMSRLPRERTSVLGCELQPPQLGNPLPEVSRLPPAAWSQGILLTSPGQGDRVCEFRGRRGRRELGRTLTADLGHRGCLTSGQPKGWRAIPGQEGREPSRGDCELLELPSLWPRWGAPRQVGERRLCSLHPRNQVRRCVDTV